MNTFTLDTRITSRAFRHAVVTAFPAAERDPAYMRLLVYLLFSTWLETGGRVVLRYKQVAACAGAEKQAKQRNYSAQALLADFEARVMPLNLKAHDRSKRLARTALPCWPEPVQIALQVELNLPRAAWLADAVYFVSGNAYSERSHKGKLRMKQRQSIESLLQHDHPALELMHYANNQQRTIFNRLVERNGDAARLVADSLEKHDRKGQPDPAATRRARDSAKNIIRCLENDAKPLYKPSEKGKTVRIFADNQTYLGLPKAVRRALMPECPELDLRNAQLAIAARDWDIPAVQDYLQTGQSIWPELERHFDLPAGRHKPILKTTLYSLMYGMGKDGLVWRLANGDGNTSGIGRQKAGTLFDHQLIQALFTAREQELSTLEAVGFAKTCFGQVIEVHDREEARSALAAQAQARELWLLLPAVEKLKAKPELTLVAWQHDGFTIHSSSTERKTRYVKQLQQVVNARASVEGYATELELGA